MQRFFVDAVPNYGSSNLAVSCGRGGHGIRVSKCGHCTKLMRSLCKGDCHWPDGSEKCVKKPAVINQVRIFVVFIFNLVYDP